MSHSSKPTRPAALANWLMIVAFLVVLMVAVGGITRLTESGLSITQWKPITGAIPPLSEAAIPQGYKGRLVALLALGGLQGVFGWFMVRSGLAGTMTDVSHFWLSIHLLTALFTLGGLIWTALDLRQLATGASRPARWTGTASWVGAILFVQLLLGAWVAGLNAGLASDTWPLMQGQLVPEYDRSRGLAWAVTHDPFLLHFLHRWWAWIAVIALVVMARRVKPLVRQASVAIHTAFGIQILLGVATVWTGVALWVAVAHQVVGALLVASFAWGAHILGRRTG